MLYPLDISTLQGRVGMKKILVVSDSLGWVWSQLKGGPDFSVPQLPCLRY